MQEYATDYYEHSYNSGCCLKCSDAHKGCLCKYCNCTKCYWYSSPQKWDGKKGHCDKTDELIEERKIKFKEQLEIQRLRLLKNVEEQKAKEKDRMEKVEQFNKNITIKPEEVKDGRCIDELQEL